MATAWNTLRNATFAQCERVFGDEVEFLPVVSQPETTGAVALRGIFDDSAKIVETEGQASVSTFAPRIDIAYTALTIAPEEGDRVVVDGVTYTMIDVKAGDANSWRCILHVGVKNRW
jgi:hypothetical protein